MAYDVIQDAGDPVIEVLASLYLQKRWGQTMDNSTAAARREAWSFGRAAKRNLEIAGLLAKKEGSTHVA